MIFRKPLKRSRMKSKPVKRFWQHAIEKIESEGCCRACGATDFVDACHIVPRRFDEETTGPRGGKYLYVDPRNVIALCGAFSEQNHHAMFDSHDLDLLEVITEEEFEYAVGVLGYERALKRVSGGAA